MALVYDPATGRMVDDGQPVNVGRSLGNIALGATTAVPATLLDAARRGVTTALGGDVATLPGGADFYSSRAFGTLDQGLSNFGEANASLGRNVQRGLLGLVGAQPAAPAVAPPAEPVSAVRAAPVAAAAPAAPTGDMLGEADVAAINQQIATSLGALRQPTGLQPATRGDYNQRNTPVGVPQTNGINFGFGVNGAPTAAQYLAQMQVVDQQRAQRRRATLAGLEQQRAVDDLRNARTPLEIRQAQRVVDAVTPVAQQEAAAASELAQLGQRGTAEQQIAALQTEGAMARTVAEGQNRLAAADLTGQYGLLGRQSAADATVQAAALRNTSGTNQNAAVQAQLRQLQFDLAMDALNNGDLEAAASIASGRGVQNQRIALDMLGNPVGTYDAAGNLVPYTAAQLAEYRRASGLAQQGE